MTTLVYRIETKDGKGICAATGSPLCNLYFRKCGDETEHCHFYRDDKRAKVLCERENMTFAFPSMSALKRWFPQSRGRKLMEENGALGHVYEVERLELSSPYQCVFDKTKAKLIETFELA